MTRRTTIFAAAVLAISMAAAAAVVIWPLHRRPASPVRVPDPARQALEFLARGNAIEKVTAETEENQTIYTAKWLGPGDLEHYATVTADGSLVESELEFAPERVPAAVREAVRRKFGPNAPASFMRVSHIDWEVEVQVNGKTQTVTVSPYGKIED